MSDPLQYIETTLRETLRPSKLEIQDQSHYHRGHPGAKEGGHYQVTIASPQFQQQSLQQCHRLIYQALGNLHEHGIHALSIKILR